MPIGGQFSGAVDKSDALKRSSCEGGGGASSGKGGREGLWPVQARRHRRIENWSASAALGVRAGRGWEAMEDLRE